MNACSGLPGMNVQGAGSMPHKQPRMPPTHLLGLGLQDAGLGHKGNGDRGASAGGGLLLALDEAAARQSKVQAWR